MRSFLCCLAFLTMIAAPAMAATHGHKSTAPAAITRSPSDAPDDIKSSPDGIAAIVNQDAISMRDLNDRLRLLLVSSGLPDSPDLRARMSGQAIDSLINEQLMLQEMKKQDVDLEDKDIDAGFEQLAQQNKMSADQFKAMITSSGVNIDTMRRQIKAQIGWGKIVQKVMRPQIEVNDADIDAFLERLNNNIGKNEYLVAEIFLPVDAPNQQSDARQLAEKLDAEIRAGKAPFFKVAAQFSKAPGAAQGGDRGWIQAGQLPDELDSVLKTMKKDDLSEPIHSSAGYHILYLRDTRAITDKDIPSREEIFNALGGQRLDRAQRRYLMDLRSAAFIENRVKSS